MTLSSSVWLLGSIGLMAMDEEALRLAVRVAERRLPNLPGSNAELEQARTAPSAPRRTSVGDTRPRDIQWMNGSLWFVCREAIDAGEAQRALSVVRPRPGRRRSVRQCSPRSSCGGRQQDHWQEALRLAAEKGRSPIAVDALEGLAVGAAHRGSRTIASGCLPPTTGCAMRRATMAVPLRARACRAGSGGSARCAGGTAQEDPLEWHEARRTRPGPWTPSASRHGWESLTPTELQVAEFVAEGQTNPEIAERLLMVGPR